jgi:hypothetical protein
MAQAAKLEPVSLFAAFRWHQWREQYSEQATGNPASLKEQGPLFGIGVTVPIDLLPAPTAHGTLILRNSGELFGGQVRYNGHLQNQNGTLTPYQTDVVYFGAQGAADLGWRFPVKTLTIEPFAGLGVRWWLRDLQGSGGYTEYWLSLSSRLGGRLSWLLADGLTLSAVGGAMLPLYTTNTADGSTIKPEGQWSGFGELACASGRWEHSLFYDGLRYKKSPSVRAGTVVDINGVPHQTFVLQPPSQSDIFGYRLGYRF